ncbi:autophagy-related protein 23, putative (ATG23), partial [Plasmodium malariae]
NNNTNTNTDSNINNMNINNMNVNNNMSVNNINKNNNNNMNVNNMNVNNMNVNNNTVADFNNTNIVLTANKDEAILFEIFNYDQIVEHDAIKFASECLLHFLSNFKKANSQDVSLTSNEQISNYFSSLEDDWSILPSYKNGSQKWGRKMEAKNGEENGSQKWGRKMEAKNGVEKWKPKMG